MNRFSVITLNKKSMNGKFGTIIGFHQQKERFIVKLEEFNSLKLFKPINLRRCCELTSNNSFLKFKDEPEFTKIDKGIKIIKNLGKKIKIFKTKNQNFEKN